MSAAAIDTDWMPFSANRIRIGTVGVTVPLPVACLSFDGWKRSLFGDFDANGPDSVRFFARRKTIAERRPSGGVRESAKFTFPS